MGQKYLGNTGITEHSAEIYLILKVLVKGANYRYKIKHMQSSVNHRLVISSIRYAETSLQLTRHYKKMIIAVGVNLMMVSY